MASSHAQPDGWVNIRTAAPSIVLDIRYATTNNFVNAQMYPCAECFLRSPAAEALLAAHSELQKQGYGLKMFDCYRPAPVQERLWAKMPDARYVTNPRKGSMHGRGGAADLTIVDAQEIGRAHV